MPICKEKQEAILAGKKTYFTGKPCKYGHISERYVSGSCKKCSDENSLKVHKVVGNKYQRRYYINNKEKFFKWQFNYRRREYVKYLLGVARRRAKNTNIEFSISIEDIEQTDSCPIFGTKFIVGNNDNHGRGRHTDVSPSIDRIDNTKGYVPGNVWLISWKANKMKNNSSLEDLETLTRALRNKIEQDTSKGDVIYSPECENLYPTL